MNTISIDQFKQVVADVGRIVDAVDPDSALYSLEVVATAFSALLQIYALPNANSPEGMCDDPETFRRYFAEIVATGYGTFS
jgi:hypothetical protein